MAQRVVHFLKLIERNKQNSQRLILGTSNRDGLRETIFEQRTIGKLRYGVVIGEPVNLRCSLLQKTFELFFVTPLLDEQIVMIERAFD